MPSQLISAAVPKARLIGTEKLPMADAVALARQIRGLPNAPMLDAARKLCAAGDSETAGSGNGSSYYDKTIRRSKGRFRDCGNFGVGGKRTDEIHGEQLPLVIASGARHCVTQFGTNDFAQGASQTQARARAIAWLTALRDNGVEPIVVGMFPRANGTPAAHVMFDIWLSLYCRFNDILYVPAFDILSTVTGARNASLYIDDLHPSSVGAGMVADRVLDYLNAPRYAPILARTDTAADNYNLLDNAVSFGGAGASIAPTWFAVAGSGSPATYSVEAESGGERGNWLRATLAGGTATGFVSTGKNPSAVGWDVGDRLFMAARIRWVDANQALSLTANLTVTANPGGSLASQDKGGATGEDGYFEDRDITLTGAGPGGSSWTATGTGYFEINRPLAVNLTKLGLA